MIQRNDAIAVIGYDGNAALVDRIARKQCANMSIESLLKAGLFRAAAASAIYSNNPNELSLVAEEYNRVSGSSYAVESIPRLFGVASIQVSRTVVL